MPAFTRPHSYTRPVGKGFRHSKAPEPNPHAVAISPFRHGRRLAPETKKRIETPLLKNAMLKAALGIQPMGMAEGAGKFMGAAWDTAMGRNRTNTPYEAPQRGMSDEEIRIRSQQKLQSGNFGKYISAPWESQSTAGTPGQPGNPAGPSSSQQQQLPGYYPATDAKGNSTWMGPQAGKPIDPALMQQSHFNWRPSWSGPGYKDDTVEAQTQLAQLQANGFNSVREAANAYNSLDLTKPLDAAGQQAYLAHASLQLGKPVTMQNMAQLTGMEFDPTGKPQEAEVARAMWLDQTSKGMGKSMEEFDRLGYRVGPNGVTFNPMDLATDQYDYTIRDTMRHFIDQGMSPDDAAKYAEQALMSSGVYADYNQMRKQYERIMGKGMYDNMALSDKGLMNTLYRNGGGKDTGYGAYSGVYDGLSTLGQDAGALGNAAAFYGSGKLMGGAHALGRGMAGGSARGLAALGKAIPLAQMAYGLGDIATSEEAMQRYIARVRPDMASADDKARLDKGILERLNPMDKDNYVNDWLGKRLAPAVNGLTGSDTMMGHSPLQQMTQQIQAIRDRESTSGPEGVMKSILNPAALVNGLSQRLGEGINGAGPDPIKDNWKRSWDMIQSMPAGRAKEEEMMNLLGSTQLGDDPEELDRIRASLMSLDLTTDEGKQAWNDIPNRYAGHLYDRYQTARGEGGYY